MLSAPQLPTSGNLFFVPEPFDNASASWLEPNTQSPFCGVEQLPRAQAMLNAIRSYASEVARAQRLGATVAPERVDGMTISYIPSNAAGYVLRIALDNDAAVIGPFWRCARLHEGDYDEAAQAHLFIPGWRERYQSGVQTLYFSPEVGLYFAPDAIDETVGSRSVSATFPSKRSINDVAVIPRLCPSEFEAASVQFMNDFRSYAARYYRGDQPLPAPGMEVHVHNSKAGAWLEALPANPDLTAAIALCFNIPSATQDQLSRFGLSGGIPPSINYSPKVGLYLVSPSQ
jgi:hypothetical protein